VFLMSPDPNHCADLKSPVVNHSAHCCRL